MRKQTADAKLLQDDNQPLNAKCSSMDSKPVQSCVVVTGCSSGIGYGTAKVLVEAGFHVFGSVRNVHDADRLQKGFGPNFTPLLFDVMDEAAVRNAAELVGRHLGGATLFGLVNNAGACCYGPLLYQPLTEVRRTVDINLIGTLIVTKAFLPLLGADRERVSGRPGRVIMMSSKSGRMGVPFLGAYVASKFALEGMADVLRRELLVFGIDVIILEPGAIATPIWEKADQEDLSAYDNTLYKNGLRTVKQAGVQQGREGYAPERVGRLVLKVLNARWPWARYTILPKRLWNWTLPLLMPARLLDRYISIFMCLQYVPPARQHSPKHSKVQ